jgi:hypothetical protein
MLKDKVTLFMQQADTQLYFRSEIQTVAHIYIDAWNIS